MDHRALFDAMPVPRFVMVAGKDGYVLLDANQKALSYFERPLDAIKGKSFKNFVDGESLPFFEQALESAASQKKPVSFKISPTVPGGTRLDGFMINPVSGPDGAVEYFDIMALPGGNDASSLQRERDDAISLLTSVFDVSEVGIVVTDRHQRVVRVNDSFIRIYGWRRDELIGKEFVDLMAADEREQARRNHEEFMRSGIRSSGEMKLIRRDNNIANALFTTAALELSHGRRFQVTTIMDITLRKQMEMTLRLAKEQADAANNAKSTFLANMSHELRTPLNAIIGFSEMMIKGTFGPLQNDRYKDYLGDIHLSARHLLEIINEVLDMSKIEAGRVELDEEYFDIQQLVIAVNRMMDSRAFSSGLRITDEVQPDLEPMFADPRLVRQILINLVGNAVKYSKHGGLINVKAVLASNGNLNLIVADTGIGIPKNRIHEALEPFGQINKPTEASGIQGTGLGLPLAKAMAELHGGLLGLESDVGKGTVVTVTFPAWRMGKQPEKADGKGASPIAEINKKAKVAQTGKSV